jgi:hypothetical protein
MLCQLGPKKIKLAHFRQAVKCANFLKSGPDWHSIANQIVTKLIDVKLEELNKEITRTSLNHE